MTMVDRPPHDLLLALARLSCRRPRRMRSWATYRDELAALGVTSMDALETRLGTAPAFSTNAAFWSAVEKGEVRDSALLNWVCASNGAVIRPLRSSVPAAGTPHQYIISLNEGRERLFQAEKRKHGGSTFAWHGSPAQNWTGILRSGLLSMSGTALQHHGAKFGAGVYLSPCMCMAAEYSGLEVHKALQKTAHFGPPPPPPPSPPIVVMLPQPLPYWPMMSMMMPAPQPQAPALQIMQQSQPGPTGPANTTATKPVKKSAPTKTTTAPNVHHPPGPACCSCGSAHLARPQHPPTLQLSHFNSRPASPPQGLLASSTLKCLALCEVVASSTLTRTCKDSIWVQKEARHVMPRFLFVYEPNHTLWDCIDTRTPGNGAVLSGMAEELIRPSPRQTAAAATPAVAQGAPVVG